MTAAPNGVTRASRHGARPIRLFHNAQLARSLIITVVGPVNVVQPLSALLTSGGSLELVRVDRGGDGGVRMPQAAAHLDQIPSVRNPRTRMRVAQLMEGRHTPGEASTFVCTR